MTDALSDSSRRQRRRVMERIAISNICSALNPSGVIGSKVVNPDGFMAVLANAIGAYDFTQARIPGQGLIQLPGVESFVSAGVGHRTRDPEHYVLREHRGVVSAYLKREFAEPVTACNAVVYTKAAYLADPDITPEEAARVKDADFVLVAVLAFAGPPSQLSPHRFTANLAGGNREAQVWSADEIRAKARDIMAYDSEWATVADP